jgi:2-phospho-L-lactate guanylyltransferase
MPMRLWAIVPVKPLRKGKSRLVGVLTEDERFHLNQHFLSHTIRTLNEVDEIDQVLVISSDHMTLAKAQECGARTVLEIGAPHLNNALVNATNVAQTNGVHCVMIVPTDLPQISPNEVRSIISLGMNPPVVVVTPDYLHEGTNALMVNPAGLIKYNFGVGSFQKHCECAKNVNAKLVVCELVAMAHDIDKPEDLKYLYSSPDFSTL